MTLSDDIERAVAEGAHRGLAEAAYAVARQTRDNLPVGDPKKDPDPLVAMKDHIEVDFDADGDVAQVSVNTAYAAKQHEDLRLKHPRGGLAKFLERALLQEIPKLEGIIAGEVRKQMTGKWRG